MYRLNNFSKVKVLVVGDVMVDKYLWGEVTRISPEAPVPVVRLRKTSFVVGGAANVAANIAGLGATAYLIGVVGDDSDGQTFTSVLEDAGVSARYIVKSKNRQTTVKTRILAHNQQIARLDQETSEVLNKTDELKIWKKIEAAAASANIIVISDYAKGVLSNTVLSRLIKYGRDSKKPVLVDPKGRSYSKYKGASIITPNKFEIAEACGCEAINEKDLIQAGYKLISDLDLLAVIVTRGEEGIAVMQKGNPPLVFGSVGRKVYDVTGAGDTFISTLAVALGVGNEIASASEIANLAAGLSVEEVGTTIIKISSLKEILN